MRQKHVAAAMACAGLWLGTTAVTLAQRGGTIWIRPGYYKELTPQRHQAAVERMLKQDSAAPPPAEAVLFVGSATIAGWDIPRYFPEYKTIKRGIGGSLTSEATYWADRLVIPFKPSTVVFYSGDNDLGYGMTAEMVANEFEAFVRKIHGALPDTHIVIFSIRPSIARWAVHEGVFDANKRIQAFAAKNPKLHFVDMTPLLLGADGQPARDLLDDDLHHLNVAGFDKATAKIKPVIAEAEAAYWRARKTAAASPQR
jgi:lysophospholipase L1-like esterase